MLKTSMLIREERGIFNELLSRFDALSEEQMQVVGVTREWSTKDLLGHLAHWEQGAAEQVRELQAGTWSPRKRTSEEVEQINREVTAANRATLIPQLREQFSRARAEVVSVLRDAPEDMDETFPLARIVRSQCVRHRGHHLAQLRAWVEHLKNGS
jgi:uncharacterized damage-inducible protein DinB